ncbi:hypothetical protein QBC44DRAFT_364478 [Cladorrhinum sp. PSN332]|nr:hypothetical protein QBC44DRAFT_364478 [Cladorrhinum sp. PSN332]
MRPRPNTEPPPKFSPPRNPRAFVLFIAASAIAVFPKPGGGGGGNGGPPTSGAMAFIPERPRNRLPGVTIGTIPILPCDLR